MAVRGHILGKDGIYAAALLVEMLAVTGKPISALYREITDTYGSLSYAEESLQFDPDRREELKRRIYEDRQVPPFAVPIERIGYEDGCKVYFIDGSWVICRFSGTEPLLRIAAEGANDGWARSYIDHWRKLLDL